MALAKGKTATSTPPPRHASLTEFVSGTGLFDDLDLVITDAQVSLWTYPGTTNETCALVLELKDENGEIYEQHFSGGDPEKIQPSADGCYFVPVGEEPGVRASSNVAEFLKSLTETGMPAGLLDDGNVENLIGLKFHGKRKAQPKRSGLAPRAGKNADREPTILLSTKVYGKTGATSSTSSKANGTTEDDLEGQAAAILFKILGEHKEGVQQKDLPKLGMAKLTGQKGWNKILQVLVRPDFPKSVPGVVNDEGILSLG